VPAEVSVVGFLIAEHAENLGVFFSAVSAVNGSSVSRTKSWATIVR
jgi:hypothetical protein